MLKCLLIVLTMARKLYLKLHPLFFDKYFTVSIHKTKSCPLFGQRNWPIYKIIHKNRKKSQKNLEKRKKIFKFLMFFFLGEKLTLESRLLIGLS